MLISCSDNHDEIKTQAKKKNYGAGREVACWWN